MSYRKELLDLLEEVCATRNVWDIGYYQIDETTNKEDLDFSGFGDPNNILLPNECNKLIDEYLKTELP